MFREFLARSAHLTWPQVALVIFFTFFLGVLVFLGWTFLRRKKYDEVASLPLEEDDAELPVDDAPERKKGDSK